MLNYDRAFNNNTASDLVLTENDFNSQLNSSRDEFVGVDLDTIAEDVTLVDSLVEFNFFHSYLFTLDEPRRVDLVANTGSERAGYSVVFVLFQDTNSNYLGDAEESIADFTIFNNGVTESTGFLDLEAGDYLLNISDIIVEGGSSIAYSVTLDFEETPGGEIPDGEDRPRKSDLMNTDIFRFQNTDVPGTYLYAAAEEAENIRDNGSNFEEEGFAFQVAVEPGDELIPLDRFQSNTNPGTYVFAGEEECQGINDNFAEKFTEEELAFYVYGVGANLGTVFSRFQNTDLPGTYLFAGGSEIENIEENFPNFVNEGLAFEVGI